MSLEEQIDQFLQKNEDEFLSKEHDRSNMPLYVTKLELRILLKDFASQSVQHALEEAEEYIKKSKIDLNRSKNEDDIFYNSGLGTSEQIIKSIKTKYQPITE